MRKSIYAAACSVSLLALVADACAAVTTDGSLGARTSLNGTNVLVPATLGRHAGNNLFHSFTQFDVPAGGSVTFTGPTGIKNVLARVTGGQVSQIDGALGCSIPSANLYLINPAGITFGTNSTLNVSGTFTATTADVVRLNDGKSFAVSGAGDAVLTGGEPTSFGFLSATPGNVILHDCTLINAGPGIRFAAGGVGLSNAVAFDGAGHISVAAIEKGNLAIDSTSGDLLPAADATRGTIAMIDAAIATNGIGGGRIDLHAADLSITGTQVQANSTGEQAGLGIRVDLTGLLTINDSAIAAGTTAGGAAGGITLNADVAELVNGGNILTSTTALGNAGTISVHVRKLHVAGKDAGGTNASIASDSQSAMDGGAAGDVRIDADTVRLESDGTITAATAGRGRAGAVTVNARSVVLDGTNATGGTYISTTSLNPDQGGAAGDVKVQATDVRVLNGAFISSSTYGLASAGQVNVRARRLTVDGIDASGFDSNINSSSVSTAAGGPAGGVTVRADTVAVTGGGIISSNTRGGGDAGTVAIKANAVTVRGAADVTSAISSDSRGTPDGGAGGDIRIAAGTLAVADGGVISTGTANQAAAGTVEIQADAITVDGGGLPALTGLISNSEATATGTAGDVRVTGNTIDVRNGGEISSNTYGTGAGGRVLVTAGSVRIDGVGGAETTEISSSSFDKTDGGAAGGVTVNADSVLIRHGGLISSETRGNGRAGTVAVNADSVDLDGLNSTNITGISSQAFGTPKATGAAGDIAITARALNVHDSAAVTSDTFDRGAAGRVDVHADSIKVSSRNHRSLTGILSQAGPLATGAAGDIDIHSKSLAVIGNGLVDSSTFSKSIGGDVSVTADAVRVDGLGIKSALAVIGSRSVNSGQEGGAAGDVRVAAGTLLIRGGGSVTSSTISTGAAGTVTVSADVLRIDGTGTNSTVTAVSSESLFPGTGAAGNVSVTGGDVSIKQGEISVQTFNTGRGGSVRMDVDHLQTFAAGFVSASAFGDGDAGDVVIHARQIDLQADGLGGESGIQAATSGGRGRGGNLNITADAMTLTAGAGVSATSATAGAAGSVRMDVGQLLVDRSVITSRADSTGAAGLIDIRCDDLTVLGNRSGNPNIRTDSNQSRAGDILIQATHGIDVNGGSIGTNSQAADSGNLTLNAGDHITLDHATVTAQAGANGARLTLDPLFITLNHSTLNGLANGVPVRVTVDPSALLILSNDSQILATNPNLPPDVDLTGAILHFTVPQFGGQTVLAEGCEMQLRKKNLSSFVGQERLGLPPVPGQGVMSGVSGTPVK